MSFTSLKYVFSIGNCGTRNQQKIYLAFAGFLHLTAGWHVIILVSVVAALASHEAADNTDCVFGFLLRILIYFFISIFL